jgi:hypothetical protein
MPSQEEKEEEEEEEEEEDGFEMDLSCIKITSGRSSRAKYPRASQHRFYRNRVGCRFAPFSVTCCRPARNRRLSVSADFRLVSSFRAGAGAGVLITRSRCQSR